MIRFIRNLNPARRRAVAAVRENIADYDVPAFRAMQAKYGVTRLSELSDAQIGELLAGNS